MNLVNEQVTHRQFGLGSITGQADKSITVQFSEEYGSKLFQYPLAFDQYLLLCNEGLQDTIKVEARLKAEQVAAEEMRQEEEIQRKEHERLMQLPSRQPVPVKRAPAKASTKKAAPAKASTKKAASAKTSTKKAAQTVKKQEVPLDDDELMGLEDE